MLVLRVTRHGAEDEPAGDGEECPVDAQETGGNHREQVAHEASRRRDDQHADAAQSERDHVRIEDEYGDDAEPHRRPRRRLLSVTEGERPAYSMKGIPVRN